MTVGAMPGVMTIVVPTTRGAMIVAGTTMICHASTSRVTSGPMPTGLAEMFFPLIKGFSRSGKRFLTMKELFHYGFRF